MEAEGLDALLSANAMEPSASGVYTITLRGGRNSKFGLRGGRNGKFSRILCFFFQITPFFAIFSLFLDLEGGAYAPTPPPIYASAFGRVQLWSLYIAIFFIKAVNSTKIINLEVQLPQVSGLLSILPSRYLKVIFSISRFASTLTGISHFFMICDPTEDYFNI